MKKALLTANESTKTNIYDKVKNLTIKIDEELEDFNRKYLELYQKVNEDLKSGIKVKDFLKSIKTRKGACHAVLYDEAKQ